MFVLFKYRIVEELIHHDRTCVKHRIIEPEEALKEKYAQTVVKVTRNYFQVA